MTFISASFILIELGNQCGPYKSGTLMRVAVKRHEYVLRDIEWHVKRHWYHKSVFKALFRTKDMKQLGDKLLLGDDGNLWHYCKGCDMLHQIYIVRHIKNPNHWNFNFDLVNPTLDPSVKISWHFKDEPKVCHYFITDGKINYCPDSTHEYAGKSLYLELPKSILEDFGITEKLDAIPSRNENASQNIEIGSEVQKSD